MRPLKNQINILLVNPTTPDSYWGMQDAMWFIGARAAHIPLSLITVAALLPDDWNLRLIDMNVEPLRDEDIEQADMVFLTGMIIQRESLTEVLHRCAEKNVPTLVGGPFASSTPNTEDLKDATSIFIGEAEDAIADVVTDISNGTLKEVYRSEGRPDIRTSPVPRFDLLKHNEYFDMSLQVSRGCPHGCEFCDVHVLFGRKPRYKSPKQVTAELDAILATGFHGNIFFVDDNFIGNPRRATDTLHAICEWQESNESPFLFLTEADIRLSERDDLIQLMTDAGFYAVFIGFETPSEEALRCSAKKHNIGIDVVAAVTHLRTKGLLVYGGFIVGFDTDGPESSMLVYELIDKCGIEFAMAGMLIALPGTPLEQRLRKEGRLTEESTSGDPFQISNILPKGMSRLEFIASYRKLIERLYQPKQYFKRAYASVSEWKQSSTRPPTRQELRAVIRSIVRQGIFSRYGRHYWKFIIKTLFRFPKKLPQAVSMAVCGHHLFSYTQRVVVPRLKKAELQLVAEQAQTR